MNRMQRRASKQETIVGLSFDLLDGCIDWEQLEKKLGDRYPAFCEFMIGQTVCALGVYACDVETFLRGMSVQD